MDTVVLVHGLWLPGHELALLRRRVRRCGFAPQKFRYASVRHSVAENAAQLDAFLRDLPGDAVHLVGHSLGGLVIRRLYHDFPHQRPGRVVTLGTPHAGSQAARRLARSALGRALLGASGPGALLGGMPPWFAGRELGIVAGTLNVGFARLFLGMPRSGDGVVALAETELAGATDRIELRQAHLGLLWSKEVACQVCAFLNSGQFVHRG